MLEVEGVPELAAVGLAAAEPLVVVPLHVADLAALDGPPPLAVAVDDALAGDADVRAAAGLDAALDLAVVVEEFGLVGGEEDNGAALQVKVDAVLERDGARQPDSRRDDEMPAALLRQLAYGLGEGFRVGGDAVSDAAEIGQRDRQGRDGGLLRLRQLHRKILI